MLSKKLLLITILSIAILFLSSTSIADNKNSYIVYIANSGIPEFPSILRYVSGFIDSAKDANGEYTLYTEIVNMDNSHSTSLSNHIVDDIRSLSPNFVIILGDTAYKSIGRRVSDLGIPVAINDVFLSDDDISYLFSLEDRKVIVVRENINFSPISNIIEKSRYNVSKFIILTDSSDSSHKKACAIKESFDESFNRDISEIRYVRSPIDLFTQVSNMSEKIDDLIIFYCLSRGFFTGTGYDFYSSVEELTKLNSTKIEIGPNRLYSDNGMAFSVGVDFYELGSFMGAIVNNSIKDGYSSNIYTLHTRTHVNISRLKKLNHSYMIRPSILYMDRSDVK